MKGLERKQKRLRRILARYDSLMVAFSGGVDSTYLLAEALAVVSGRLVAVTDRSAFHSQRETEFAARFAARMGVRHLVIDTGVESLDIVRLNPPDRCYHCKQALIAVMVRLAHKEAIEHIAHGANCDDLGDYRPGLRAASEAKLLAPLIEAEMYKSDIRRLSKTLQLPTWDKPPMACLATRIPYGSRITRLKLRQIDKAEDYLHHLGFYGVRVRHHGQVARLEIPPSRLDSFMDEQLRAKVVSRLRQIGFDHVALDLEGYVSGSMNRSIGADRPDNDP